MSSDDDITRVPNKPGPLRIIQGEKVASANKRPTAFQQLRTITIPPILSWMAHRVGTGHGPWTSEFEVEKVRPEKPQQDVSLGRRLRWAGLGALVAIIVGLVLATLLNRPSASRSQALMSSTAALHPVDQQARSASSTEVQSPSVPHSSPTTAIDSNNHPTTSPAKSREPHRNESVPPKPAVSPGARASQSTPEPLGDADRTF